MGGGDATDALATPTHWANVRDPMVAELTTLPEGVEKAKCEAAFLMTVPPKVKVIEVQRVQNVSMWQTFVVKKQTVFMREKDKAKQARFERQTLFHGTSEDTVPKIIQQGFNRSFAGKNMTRFGKGTYFARDAAYSSSTTYSRPNAQGIQFMFLCRVIVGDYCKGVQDAITPAVRTGDILYDSTVDEMHDWKPNDPRSGPGIYVTYHDAQAYPEYLIKFKQ